ncbi:MAG: thermonuclease family protein [Rhodospirillales bacterium]|nr:thermonuclease family protein [Rhodospirillales bacterium]
MTVIAGDIIEIEGQRVHLFGIDAPEPDQTCEWPNKTIPCGRIAATALMDLIFKAEVKCDTRGRDDNGQVIARCRADGFDISRNMVHTGWALADRNSGTVFLETENKAKAAKRGLWRGRFLMPWEWRKKN